MHLSTHKLLKNKLRLWININNEKLQFGLARVSIGNLLLISMGKSLGFNFSHSYQHIVNQIEKNNREKGGNKNERGKLKD